MKLEINYGSDAFSVPGALLGRLSELSRTELAVLLALCAEPALRADGEQAAQQLAERFGCESADVERAIGTLRGMGFVGAPRTPRRTPLRRKDDRPEGGRPFDNTQQRIAAMPISMPEYTGEQIEAMIESTPNYKVIIDQTQKICGTIFTPTEVSRVLSLADYLKLDFEHIVMLFTYCKSRGKTSVQYAVKTAYTLYNQGIDTRAAFEEYVKKSEQFESIAGQVRAIFGMGERAFTSKEKEMIAGWCKAEIPRELMERAYEITVDNTGKASMAYANKILNSWNEKGYRTLADVEQAMNEYRQQKEAQSPSSFGTDEFFEAALKRGREKMGGGS